MHKGRHPVELPSADESALAARHEMHREFLSRLDAYSNEPLSRQEELSLSVMRLKLTDHIDNYMFGAHLVPIDAEGGFYNQVLFALPNLPFNTAADYEAYLGWLPQYSDNLAAHQALMAQGIERGLVAPRVIVENSLRLMQVFLVDENVHPLMVPFGRMPASISDTERSGLAMRARDLLAERILPAYRSLERFLSDEYLAVAPEDVGVSAIPGGRAWYENRVRFFTTLPMSPDEVYGMGEAEVRRIRALMEDTIKETGFEGDFNDFVSHLRTSPEFYATSAEQLLHRAAWIAKQAEGELPKLFSRLYRTPFTVRPVPDAIAPNYTGGRYVQPNEDTRQPGMYWVNTYNLPSRSLYNLTALTLHEAVPGHHLQIALARELGDIPRFRNDYYLSAFGEGWGLYAEYLGEEMGMYETPYDWFGRYTYEMWRACRLVVDVGMHYKGWSREKARTFLRDNTALSEHEVETEIDRYIGWPAQAVSYKIGELTIKRLRNEAESELGDRFDIREFHETALENGSIPLDKLEQQIRQYILRKSS